MYIFSDGKGNVNICISSIFRVPRVHLSIYPPLFFFFSFFFFEDVVPSSCASVSSHLNLGVLDAVRGAKLSRLGGDATNASHNSRVARIDTVR